jgi:hypothetical protein
MMNVTPKILPMMLACALMGVAASANAAAPADPTTATGPAMTSSRHVVADPTNMMRHPSPEGAASGATPQNHVADRNDSQLTTPARHAPSPGRPKGIPTQHGSSIQHRVAGNSVALRKVVSGPIRQTVAHPQLARLDPRSGARIQRSTTSRQHNSVGSPTTAGQRLPGAQTIASNGAFGGRRPPGLASLGGTTTKRNSGSGALDGSSFHHRL